MQPQPYLLHALSALHAGVGSAAGVIDLPIARMKATGMPFVPGSSIKGVLRDARSEGATISQEKVNATFGPKDNPQENAGALVVGDARLLALPVRSFKGVFAWVTSPLLLVLANRDLGTAMYIPQIRARGARITPKSACVATVGNRGLYLEDLDLQAEEDSKLAEWTSKLAPLASPGEDIFSNRFVVVDDDTMTFLWETATQVDARVRLNENRTVAKGALWQEESLPAETLLIGLLAADRSRRRSTELNGWGLPTEVLDFALPATEPQPVLQFGGKATIGRGRCRMLRLN